MIGKVLPVLNLYNHLVFRLVFSVPQQVSVKRKELAGQSGPVGRVSGTFPSDVVVEDPTVR